MAGSLLESTTQYCTFWTRTQPTPPLADSGAVRNFAFAVSVTATKLPPVQMGEQGLTPAGKSGYPPAGGGGGPGGCTQGWEFFCGPGGITYSSDKSSKMAIDSELSCRGAMTFTHRDTLYICAPETRGVNAPARLS